MQFLCLFIYEEHTGLFLTGLFSGAVTTIAGGVGLGFEDGIGTWATFSKPGYVTIKDDAIFVSDTENCALRSINARSKSYAM